MAQNARDCEADGHGLAHGDHDIAAGAFRRRTGDLKAADLWLESWRRRYRNLFEMSLDGYIVTDVRGMISDVNETMARLMRVDPDRLMGRSILSLAAQPTHETLARLLDGAARGIPREPQEILLKPRRQLPFPAVANVAGPRRSAAGDAGLLWTFRDVTVRRRAEEDLRRAQETLEREVRETQRLKQALVRLSGRLLAAQDEERRKITRELHDTTVQKLAAIRIHLSLLEKVSAATLEPEAIRELHASIALTDEAEREVRTLANLLYPPLLDQIGLVPALRWYVERFERETRVAVGLEVRIHPHRLPAEVETALFRVVQEALTNIHRHSKSATAQVQVDDAPGGVNVRIVDQGIGLPDSVLRPDGDVGRAGMGLIGMRERIGQLGGRLDISSARTGPRTGTTIAAHIPCEPRIPGERPSSIAAPGESDVAGGRRGSETGPRAAKGTKRRKRRAAPARDARAF